MFPLCVIASKNKYFGVCLYTRDELQENREHEFKSSPGLWGCKLAVYEYILFALLCLRKI